MTEYGRIPAGRVRSLWRRVVAVFIAAALGAALATGCALLLAGWLAGRFALFQRPSVWPLALVALAALALGVWLVRVGRRLAGWTRAAAAAELEARTGLRRGSVRGAVEPGAARPGTSLSLLDLHRSQIGRKLQRAATGAGGRAAATARRHALAAGAVAVIGLVAWSAVRAVLPEEAAAARDAVLHPVRQLTAPPRPPVRIAAASDTVRRGAGLPVEVEATGRDSVRLIWRPRGEVARDRWVPLVAGRARDTVPRVETPTRYWAQAMDGASSDTLTVVPVDPLLLIDLAVALRFAPHTGRARETLRAPFPPFSVPEGTRATVAGKTTRPIERAALRSANGRTLALSLEEDRRFESTFRVRDGVWGWEIAGEHGDTLEGEPDSLRFTLVADSAPRVRILYPGADTVLSVEMTQPLMIDVRDDYGLARVELVSWRVSAWGERWPEQVERLDLPGDVRRTNLTPVLDARGRGFLPGDTLHYYARAFDNAPDAGVGRSREYVLRLPTMDELRERTVAETHELIGDAEELAERARAHADETAALDRSTDSRPAPGARDAGQRSEAADVRFRDTEAARRALEESEALVEKAREIQEAMQELRSAVERAGLNDSTVLDRLREIESLYRRILTPELREKLESLREALTDLDPERIRDAVRQLAESSETFRERVERSVELLRRAALEQEFATLETEAQELAQAQGQLAEDVGTADSTAALERRAEDLAERADSLGRRIGEFARELEGAGERQAGERATEAAEASSRAGELDRRTGRELSQRREAARRSAESAHERMRAAATALRQGREGMQGSWRQQVVEALDRARTESLELARRQQALNERLESRDPAEQADLRSEEVALRRGLDAIQEQLAGAAETSLLIEPALMNALGQVKGELGKLLEQMGDGTRGRQPDPGLGPRVSEGLNELAYRLMQAGDAAASASSGTGVQEALERLGQLAERQGELNARSGGLTPGGLTDAVMQQLRALAEQQRGIASRLENLDQTLGPRGQVLGELDALAQEAEEIAGQMERGRLDAEVKRRQDRLFQRLLDAGRTLERDEFEKERRAERPQEVDSFRPGALPSELRGGPRYPHPAAEMLRGYPPAMRRLILEYFDRLNGLEGQDGS